MGKCTSIAVIGLGLIGGSILKKLQNTGYNLIGVSRSQKTIDKATEEGLISTGSTDISVIKDADIVFICTPINKTIPILIEVAKIAKKDAIITDVASLKGLIMDFVNTSHDPIRFIGGHPMAGTEQSGIDASFPELFKGAKWVLTPSNWTTEDDIKTLETVINQLEARTVLAEPQQHDKAVALISHMPLFISQSIYSLVKNYPDRDTGELAMQLAASGFRDMTRLAATNPELASDMLIENRTNVLNTVRELVKEASLLEKQLAENEEKFTENCEDIASSRKNMYSPDGRNIYKKIR